MMRLFFILLVVWGCQSDPSFELRITEEGMLMWSFPTMTVLPESYRFYVSGVAGEYQPDMYFEATGQRPDLLNAQGTGIFNNIRPIADGLPWDPVYVRMCVVMRDVCALTSNDVRYEKP